MSSKTRRIGRRVACVFVQTTLGLLGVLIGLTVYSWLPMGSSKPGLGAVAMCSAFAIALMRMHGMLFPAHPSTDADKEANNAEQAGREAP